MTRKIFHVNYNDTILKAITTMYSKRIGSVIVTNNNNNNNNNSSDSNNNTEPYGIFTGRDLITKIVFKDIGNLITPGTADLYIALSRALMIQ